MTVALNLEGPHEGNLAEDIVGHPLPGSVMRGGSLHALREQVAAAGLGVPRVPR